VFFVLLSSSCSFFICPGTVHWVAKRHQQHFQHNLDYKLFQHDGTDQPAAQFTETKETVSRKGTVPSGESNGEVKTPNDDDETNRLCLEEIEKRAAAEDPNQVVLPAGSAVWVDKNKDESGGGGGGGTGGGGVSDLNTILAPPCLRFFSSCLLITHVCIIVPLPHCCFLDSAITT
jgi:hypothetical protein